MNAIIYTTNTGSTECYARLLTQKTGLPAYSLAEAKKRVFAGTEIIYLGWIMAGSVKGYAEAAKRYRVRAVCGVGMGQTGTQTDSIRKQREVCNETNGKRLVRRNMDIGYSRSILGRGYRAAGGFYH